MAIDIDLINKLKQLGFTEYESKVFLALLKGGIMGASEAADDAGIRRTDVYTILKSFVEKGYCNEIETNSVLKFEMIDPEVVLDKIERRIIKSREEEISVLKSAFKELKPLYKTNERESGKTVSVQLIRGYNQHRVAKFVELFKQAKEEILFMVRLEHQVSEEIDETAKAFFENGGIIKSIYEANSTFKVKKDNSWTTGTIKDLINICYRYESFGEQIKLTPTRVPNITIFDRKIVFINITDKTVPKHNEADIIIRNTDFALNMIQVFDSYWKNSFKIEEFETKFLKRKISKQKQKNIS